VRSVIELEPGGEHGLGALSRFEWRSKLPYSLMFDLCVTRSEPPHLLEARASGELEGIGVWRLYEGAAGTAVVYSWDVSTTRAWMNRLAPIARPAFAWNTTMSCARARMVWPGNWAPNGLLSIRPT
jgi:hypothetical protein